MRECTPAGARGPCGDALLRTGTRGVGRASWAAVSTACLRMGAASSVRKWKTAYRTKSVREKCEKSYVRRICERRIEVRCVPAHMSGRVRPAIPAAPERYGWSSDHPPAHFQAFLVLFSPSVIDHTLRRRLRGMLQRVYHTMLVRCSGGADGEWQERWRACVPTFVMRGSLCGWRMDDPCACVPIVLHAPFLGTPVRSEAVLVKFLSAHR